MGEKWTALFETGLHFAECACYAVRLCDIAVCNFVVVFKGYLKQLSRNGQSQIYNETNTFKEDLLKHVTKRKWSHIQVTLDKLTSLA